MGKILMIILLLLFPAIGEAATLYQNDFNSATNLTAVGGWGGAVLDNTGGVSGTKAAKIPYPSAGGNAGIFVDLSPYSLQGVYVSFWAKVDCGVGYCGGGAKFLKLFNTWASDSYANSTMRLVYENGNIEGIGLGDGSTLQNDDGPGNIYFDGWSWDSSTVIQASSSAYAGLKDKQWHKYEMWMRYNSNNLRDGEYKVWIDGALKIHATNVKQRHNSNPLLFNRFELGGYSSAPQFTSAFNIWFDDILVADSIPGADTTGPTVSSKTPVAGATDVALNSAVTVNFSEAMDCATVTTSAVTIAPQPGSWTRTSCSGSQAIFTPSSQANSTGYVVTVGTGVRDLAGNSLLTSNSWSYTTIAAGDSTPPTVASALVNGSTVTVNWNESVVTTGYDAGDFNLDCATAGQNISLTSPIGTGASRTFTAATAVGYGDTCDLDYIGSTNDIEDLAGNDMVAINNIAVTNSTPQPGAGPPSGTVIFSDSFNDNSWSGRGYVDGTSSTGSVAGGYSGNGLRWAWAQGQIQPTGFSLLRKQLSTQLTDFLVEYYIKFETGWRGSGQAYHPHLISLMTTQDGLWDGLSNTNGTLYFDALANTSSPYTNYPIFFAQDSKRVNISNGTPPVNLASTTENRSAFRCNNASLSGGSTGGDCYSTGANTYYSSSAWKSTTPIPANQWVKMSTYIKRNTFTNGIGNYDGILKIWLDGTLVLDKTGVLYAAGAYQTTSWDKLQLAPWIGDGAPIAQAMWLDELAIYNVASSDTTAPSLSAPSSLGTLKNKTPSFSFTSNEAGTITYGGSCSSPTTTATAGVNTITLSTLSIGSKSNCTITVTDSSSNASTPLSIPTFHITYPGDLDFNRNVNIFDYNILLTNFGQTNCGNSADIDGNCNVNIFDYNTMIGDFGKGF